MVRLTEHQEMLIKSANIDATRITTQLELSEAIRIASKRLDYVRAQQKEAAYLQKAKQVFEQYPMGLVGATARKVNKINWVVITAEHREQGKVTVCDIGMRREYQMRITNLREFVLPHP